MASLVATQCQDIERLITVVGNLDAPSMDSRKTLIAAKGSLNPADAWEHLQSLPQTHFVGGQDGIIEPSISRSYAARFPPTAPLAIKVIPTFDHHCCWEERWPNLLQEVMNAK